MATCAGQIVSRLTIFKTQKQHPPFQGGFFRLDLPEVVQKNMGVGTVQAAGVHDASNPMEPIRHYAQV